MCWIVERYSRVARVSATQCSPRPTRILNDFVSWLLGSQFKTCFFGMGHADTSEEIFCLDDWQIVSSPAASIQWDISRCTNDSSLDCPLVCSLYWLFWFPFPYYVHWWNHSGCLLSNAGVWWALPVYLGRFSQFYLTARADDASSFAPMTFWTHRLMKLYLPPHPWWHSWCPGLLWIQMLRRGFSVVNK